MPEPSPSPDGSLSHEERSKLIQEFTVLREKNERLQLMAKDGLVKYLHGLVGPYADILLGDKNATCNGITSANPAIREASLRLAECHWNMADEIADQCEALAERDPSEEVRCVAIGILGLAYSYAKEPRIFRLLARIVKDGLCSEKLRLKAYYGLVEVDGRHSHAVSPFKLSMSDINWPFVEKCYVAKRRR